MSQMLWVCFHACLFLMHFNNIWTENVVERETAKYLVKKCQKSVPKIFLNIFAFFGLIIDNSGQFEARFFNEETNFLKNSLQEQEPSDMPYPSPENVVSSVLMYYSSSCEIIPFLVAYCSAQCRKFLVLVPL